MGLNLGGRGLARVRGILVRSLGLLLEEFLLIPAAVVYQTMDTLSHYWDFGQLWAGSKFSPDLHLI